MSVCVRVAHVYVRVYARACVRVFGVNPKTIDMLNTPFPSYLLTGSFGHTYRKHQDGFDEKDMEMQYLFERNKRKQ